MKKILFAIFVLLSIKGTAQTTDKFYGNRTFDINTFLRTDLNGTDSLLQQQATRLNLYKQLYIVNKDSLPTKTASTQWCLIYDSVTKQVEKELISNVGAGTGMANPMTTAGDIIYENATPAPARLAAGTATQVLHSGSTPSWSAVSLVNDVTGNLAVTNLNSGTSAGPSTFWCGDGTWKTAGGGVTVGGSSGNMQINKLSNLYGTPLINGDTATGSFLSIGSSTIFSDALNIIGNSTREALLRFIPNSNSAFVGLEWTAASNAAVISSLKTDASTGEVRLFCGSGSMFPTFYSNNGEAMRIDPATKALLIGGTSSITSSLFAVESTTKASIPAPVMTSANRDAISSPTDGDRTYVNDVHSPSYYDGSNWRNNGNPLIFSATAAGTALTNSTTQTSILGTGFGTLSIPANTLKVGQTITAHGWLSLGTASGTQTILVYLMNNTHSNANLLTLPPSLSSGTIAEYTVTCTVITTGSSGTMSEYGSLTINGQTMLIASNMDAGTLDTTVANVFDVQAQWTNASTSNTIKVVPNFTLKVQ